MGDTEAGSPRTVLELLRLATGYLSEKGIATARLDAELLLGHVLGLDRLTLYVQHDRPVDSQETAAYRRCVAERAQGKPVAYIVGEREFYGLPFFVEPGVLIPRPETEQLLEAALEHLVPEPPGPVIDLGTGSGILAVCLAKHLPHHAIYAVDLSPQALRVAERNAARHGVAERIRFVQGHWLRPLAPLGLQGQVAAIVSNPPYIPTGELAALPRDVRQYEPHQALDGGPDGLSPHREILRGAPAYLRPGGLVALEIGPGQGAAILESAQRTGAYGKAEVRRDLAGRERVAIFVMEGKGAAIDPQAAGATGSH